MSKPSPTTIQSASRAVRVLLAVSSAPEGLTARDLAVRLSLTTPTAHNLLRTLVVEGVVERANGTSRYVLGPLAAVIADGVSATVRAPAAYVEALEEVAERTGETAYLSGWRRGTVTLLRTVHGEDGLEVATPPAGYSAHLHARASGKLLLAMASAEVREAFLRQVKFEPLTPHTITSVDEFKRELTRVREARIAYDREEFVQGATGVSVPIWASGRVIASMSVHAPTERFEQKERQIVEVLHRRATEISHSGEPLT